MKKSKLKNIIFYVIVWGAIALLALIALTSIFKSNPDSMKLPFYTGPAFLIAAAIVIALIYKLNILSKINTTVFLILTNNYCTGPKIGMDIFCSNTAVFRFSSFV